MIVQIFFRSSDFHVISHNDCLLCTYNQSHLFVRTILMVWAIPDFSSFFTQFDNCCLLSYNCIWLQSSVECHILPIKYRSANNNVFLMPIMKIVFSPLVDRLISTLVSVNSQQNPIFDSYQKGFKCEDYREFKRQSWMARTLACWNLKFDHHMEARRLCTGEGNAFPEMFCW